MPATIDSVTITPQTIDAGAQVIIAVGVTFPAYDFDDLDLVTWNTVDGLLWNDIDKNLVVDTPTLVNHYFQVSGGPTDQGTVLTNGTYYVNFLNGTGDKRLSLNYDVTVDKTKDYILSLEVKTVQGTLSLYCSGPIVDDTTYDEKSYATISTAYAVSPSGGVKLMENTALADGFHRIKLWVPAAYFTGAGNTGKMIKVYTGWNNPVVYEYYYRNPQFYPAQ